MSKRKQFSIQDKVAALDRIKSGASRSLICKELGLAESSLRGWLKNESKLRDSCMESEDAGSIRKRARFTNDHRLETAVITWFQQQRAAGAPISGPIIQAQAIKFDKQINGESSHFSASNGWLQKFKERHGISQFSIVGESRSADLEAAESFAAKLKKIIAEEDLTMDQIYNCDETALFYKMMPTKTLAQKTDINRTAGHKEFKERLTALLCCNKTGKHKVRPLVIGKSAKPRCFKHVNMKKLSCDYANTQRAWMTSTVFTDWFHDSFVPQVRRFMRKSKLEEKAILLLDNCSAHPPNALVSKCKKIKCVFLPPNTTSKIQPCDQGIISAVKRQYRRRLMQHLLEVEGADIPQALKTVTLKLAMELFGYAWDSLSASSIDSIWMHALGDAFADMQRPVVDSDDDNEEFLGFTKEDIYGPLLTPGERELIDPSLSDDDITAWFSCDNSEPTNYDKTDEEIVASVTTETTRDILEASDDDEDTEPVAISGREVIECTDKLLAWLEQQSDDNIYVMTQARNIAHFVRKSIREKSRQSSITDFFKK